NPKRLLKPEMFAAIHATVGKHQALVVPAGAIIHEGSATTVFLRNGEKSDQRNIVVGQAVDGKIEVLSGLHAGDEVAADGAELLKGGPRELSFPSSELYFAIASSL